ncbi:MAG: replication factor C large subunit [Candidatus Hadarchaeales archaeon]
MSELWVDKYSPKKLSEVIGQPTAIREMKSWADSWKRGKPSKKAILLYGPPGTGKSVSCAALAREMGWELVEMNASDERTLSEVERVAGGAAVSGTLTDGLSGRKLIVLDEADRIHGTADRGGLKALKELVEKTRNPIVLIANDLYAIPWDIRASCLAVNFRRISSDAIAKRLGEIARKEKVSAEDEALKAIGDVSNGDLRSAILDFQTIAAGRKSVKKADVLIYYREREKNVFDLIRGLLSARGAKQAREILLSVDISPDDALAWITENVPPMISDPQALAKVYDKISAASFFLVQASLKQIYWLWGYASDLMSAGVALHKGENLKWRKFQPPTYIKKYAQARVAQAIMNSIAKKFAAHCHTSTKVVKRDMLPYFSLLKKDKELLESLSAKLELTEQEMDFLKSR